MKKYSIIIALVALLLSSCQSEGAPTQTFTDDLGRTVTLPAELTRIAPSGYPSQILLFTLAPDKMVGWAGRPKPNQAKYIKEQYTELPEFGSFFGKRGNLNSEALTASNAQLVVDFGEEKQGIREDLDKLQQKIGIPIVFIKGDLETMSSAYTKLGALLNCEDRAKALADFCNETIDYAATKSDLVQTPARIYLGDGNDGLEAVSATSVHGRVIQMIGAENIADIAKTQGNGGSTINGEQLLNWNPEIILINRPAAFEKSKQSAIFKSLDKPMYLVPNALYNWLGRPPSINQLMGIYWLGNLVYPDIYDADVRAKAKQFYKLFFDYQMSDEELNALLLN